MLKLMLEIDLENDAYRQGLGERAIQLKENLKDVSARIINGVPRRKIRDTNGNKVGYFAIIQED